MPKATVVISLVSFHSIVELEGFTPVSPIKNAGLVAFTTLETRVELLRA